MYCSAKCYEQLLIGLELRKVRVNGEDWSYNQCGIKGPDIGLQPSRKRGPPLSKWDDMLPNIVKQYFPLSEQSFDTISLHILWTFTPVFSPFPYGIVVVMFEIRAGAKQNTYWTLHFEEHLLNFFRQMVASHVAKSKP